jgi:hypothetical protein
MLRSATRTIRNEQIFGRNAEACLGDKDVASDGRFSAHFRRFVATLLPRASRASRVLFLFRMGSRHLGVLHMAAAKKTAKKKAAPAPSKKAKKGKK